MALKADIQDRQDTAEQHHPKLLWRLYALIKNKDILPISLFFRQHNHTWGKVRENTDRRLSTTGLAMFIQCMIIIVYLEK